MREATVETRNPKPEGRRKPELRNPKSFAGTRRSRCHAVRASVFGLLSAFDLRPSDFAMRSSTWLFSSPPSIPPHLLPKPPSPTAPKSSPIPPLVYEPPAPEAFRVQLKSGPIAYVVPDRELPLVNIVVYAHTGSVRRTGRQRRAGRVDRLPAGPGRHQVQDRRSPGGAAGLPGRAPQSGIGEDQGSVSLNLLSKDLDEGLAILREVLTAPRFQDDKIALRKQQMLQEMQQRNDESAAIEEREQGFLAFGDQLLGQPLFDGCLRQFHHPRRPGSVPPAMVPSRQLRRRGQRRLRPRPNGAEARGALRAPGRSRAKRPRPSRPTPPSPRPAFTS